jgi:hypothetical protein
MDPSAAHYDQFFGPLYFEPYALEVIKRIDPAPVAMVLEIAAGTGRVTRHIRERISPSAKLIASDISEDMLAIAQKKLGHLAIDWQNIDAQELPFADNSIDRLGAGVVQLGLDGSKLDPDEQLDNFIPTNMTSAILPDAKIGAYYSNNRWYAGLSVDNLIVRFFDKKNEQNYLIPAPNAHFYLTAGMLIPLSEDIQLKPSFLIKDYKGGPTSLDINSFILFGEKLWVGASYRTAVSLYNKNYLQPGLNKDNSVVGIIQLFARNSLKIG